MPQQVKKDYNITPEEYQEILQEVEFQSASLIKLKYECKIAQDEPVKIGLETNSEIRNQENKSVIVSTNFYLKGKIKNKTVLSIEGEYLLDFLSDKAFTEEFFEIFQDMSIRVLLWPYLRELFSNITQRSNMPPFILPLIKFIPKDD